MCLPSLAWFPFSSWLSPTSKWLPSKMILPARTGHAYCQKGIVKFEGASCPPWCKGGIATSLPCPLNVACLRDSYFCICSSEGLTILKASFWTHPSLFPVTELYQEWLTTKPLAKPQIFALIFKSLEMYPLFPFSFPHTELEGILAKKFFWFRFLTATDRKENNKN